MYAVEAYLRDERGAQRAPLPIAEVYGSQAVVTSIDPRRVYASAPGDVAHGTIRTEVSGPNGDRYPGSILVPARSGVT